MNDDEMIERLEAAATTLARDEGDFLLEGKPASARQAADALTNVVSVLEALRKQNRGNPNPPEASTDAAAAGAEPSPLFMAYGDAGDEHPEPIGLFVRRADADRALEKVAPLFVATNNWPFTPDASYEAWLGDTCEERSERTSAACCTTLRTTRTCVPPGSGGR